MRTSSFSLYQGPGRIAISRSVPLHTSKGYRVYRALAPDRNMLRMAYEPYLERYRAFLHGLDPAATWDELHRLAGGAEPVLLCWERLHEPGEWCHRRMVADWFRETLGVDVPELRGQVRRELFP